MTGSVVSSTDVQIFKRLANPEIADVELLPPTGQRESQRKVTASLREAVERAGKEEVDAPASGAKSVLERAMETARAARKEEAETDHHRRSSEPEESKSSRPPPPEEEPPPRPAPQPPSPPTTPPRRPPPDKKTPVTKNREESSRQPAHPPSLGAAHDDSDDKEEDERMEKQGYLIELRRMEARGVELSRRFSENDSLAELEFEVAKQNAASSTENSVNFMRDMLRLVITGLEVGNNKLGPFLSMDGWAEATTRDMHRYDHALERIHRRYFRKHQMSPIMEMGWLLLGSLAMWHFKSKFLGSGEPAGAAARNNNKDTKRGSSTAPEPSSSGSSSAFQGLGGLLGSLAGGISSSRGGGSPPPRTTQVPPPTAGAHRRPLLRAPGTLFGPQ